MPHVAPNNIEKYSGRLLKYRTVAEDKVKSSKHRFYAGQLLYSKIRPNLSKAVVVDFDGLCSADMYPVNPLIDRDYLLRYILSACFVRMVIKSDTRVAMPKTNQAELNQVLVALPPLAEQRHIVAKVESLMALCDTLQEQRRARESCRQRATRSVLASLTSAPRAEANPNSNGTANPPGETLASAWQRLSDHFEVLLDQPETLSQLRQSILQLAVQGKLVPQDPEDEPASTIKQHIEGELTELIEQKTVRKPKKLDSLEPEEILFNLPSGWAWIQAQDVCKPVSLITYGVLKAVWVDDGVPTVRVKDMKNGEIDPTEVAQCCPERAAKFTKTTLETGDLLIAKDGGTLGKTGFVPESLAGGNITQHVLRFPISRLVSRFYIRLVIDSPHGQGWMSGETKGVALPGVNVGDFRRMPVPLPPLAEQKRIVSKVSVLLSQLDELSARLHERQAATEELLTALIHRILEK